MILVQSNFAVNFAEFNLECPFRNSSRFSLCLENWSNFRWSSETFTVHVCVMFEMSMICNLFACTPYCIIKNFEKNLGKKVHPGTSWIFSMFAFRNFYWFYTKGLDNFSEFKFTIVLSEKFFRIAEVTLQCCFSSLTHFHHLQKSIELCKLKRRHKNHCSLVVILLRHIENMESQIFFSNRCVFYPMFANWACVNEPTSVVCNFFIKL